MKEEHRRLVLLRRALLANKMSKLQVWHIIRRFWMNYETLESFQENIRTKEYIEYAFFWRKTCEGDEFWQRINSIYRDFLEKNGINS